MYGPKWPFLLLYGSHDMRYTDFPQVDGLSTNPQDLGGHRWAFRALFVTLLPPPGRREGA